RSHSRVGRRRSLLLRWICSRRGSKARDLDHRLSRGIAVSSKTCRRNIQKASEASPKTKREHGPTASLTLLSRDQQAGVVRNNWVRPARSVFGWGVDQKIISDNPFERIKIKVRKRPRDREGRAFEEAEQATIL